MHYVIGDVHGCFDDLMKLLETIDEKDKDASIIFVGDFLDKGPKVMETLNWFMENITSDGKYQSVRGNHEDLFLDWYGQCQENWMNGMMFFPTANYGFEKVALENGLTTEENLRQIAAFIRSLSVRKDIIIPVVGKGDTHYVIAHAWASVGKTREEYEKLVPLLFEEQSKGNFIEVQDDFYKCMWSRHFARNLEGEEIVVHGHTPTALTEYENNDGLRPGLISFEKNAINVDGGAMINGMIPEYPCMLGAICLETLEEIYPYSLLERFTQFYEDEKTDVEPEELVNQYIAMYGGNV